MSTQDDYAEQMQAHDKFMRELSLVSIESQLEYLEEDIARLRQGLEFVDGRPNPMPRMTTSLLQFDMESMVSNARMLKIYVDGFLNIEHLKRKQLQAKIPSR